MSKRAQVLWLLGGAVTFGLLGWGATSIFQQVLEREELRTVQELYERNTAPAASYQPACQAEDLGLCTAWNSFRKNHPFPYQTIAAGHLPDGSLAFVISEPPPRVSAEELTRQLKMIFEAAEIHRFKWYIGEDGWLEDVVFRYDSGSETPTPSDPLEDPDVLDRVAVLHEVLFGSAYLGDLESLEGATLHRTDERNLSVTAAELSSWIRDAGLKWHALDIANTASRGWTEAFALGALGAFASDDGQLVALTFPQSLLSQAQEQPQTLAALEVPFRKFAVASDMIFGSTWEPGGQVTILSRARTEPYTALPPLRFETFALLARESSDELAQSYERTTPFAGRLDSGLHRFRDWAPIYLSASLVNTELGALLNITDQMLKSWSQAGEVEYLFFDYPKPDRFPFGGRSLSEIVQEQFGSGRVLFNWNTSGAASVVFAGDRRILTAKRTGSLPVTYGANGIPKSQGGADMFEFEEDGYDYFSGLGDPNLARVVQYTTLYQTFRAMAAERVPESSPEAEDEWNSRAVNEALALALGKVLGKLRQGELEVPTKLDYKLREKVELLRQAVPDLSDERLAVLLLDSTLPLVIATDLEKTRIPLQARKEQFDREVDLYNDRVRAAQEAEPSHSDLLGLRDLPLEEDPFGGSPRWPGVLTPLYQENKNPFGGSWPGERDSHFWRRQQIEQILGQGTRPESSEVDRVIRQLKNRNLLGGGRQLWAEAQATLRQELGREHERLEAVNQSLDAEIHTFNSRQAAFQEFVEGAEKGRDPFEELGQRLNSVMPFWQDLEGVRRDFVAARGSGVQGFIHTPSIVVSWHQGLSGLLGVVGGHNLRAKAFKLVRSNDVSGIKIELDALGNTILKYNPKLAASVEANASRLAREIEHRNIRDEKVLLTVATNRAPARSRSEALRFPNHSTRPTFGRLGAREYRDKTPFIEDLRKLAQENQCCIFVARDSRQVAYVAEPKPAPPSGVIRVLEIRDTASLSKHLGRHAGRAGMDRAVVMLDMQPKQVDALAKNMTAEMSRSVGRRAGIGKSDSILSTDLQGRHSLLETLGETLSRNGKVLLTKIGLRQPASVWRRAEVRQVETQELAKMLQAAQWLPEHGLPTALKLSFVENSAPPQMTVIGGFDQPGEAKLWAAHQTGLNIAADRGGTPAQYLMTLRSQLQALPEGELKRLVMVVEDREGQLFLARLEIGAENAAIGP